jgi:uncharacterized protein
MRPCGNISPVEFEWDARKATLDPVQAWRRLCGGEFGDPFEATIPDPIHSGAELRFVSSGLSQAGRLPVVVYTERDRLIRIFSARESTPGERIKYESQG